MKVRIKKTGQILNVEYDDDDLYEGWDGGAVWFYANEFDIIDEEEADPKPLFTLTAEEVEASNLLYKIADRVLDQKIKESMFDDNLDSGINALKLKSVCQNLLTRIKQWQDGNKN